MKKYILLRAISGDELETAVNEHIMRGYEPAGGPFQGSLHICQALILKTEPPIPQMDGSVIVPRYIVRQTETDVPF